jgi:hypothetical protein
MNAARMHTPFPRVITTRTVGFACTLAAALALPALASSHREAPAIIADPLADNTDVYAFRSPDLPDTVTLIANVHPQQRPQDGVSAPAFGTNIRYEIHVENDGTAGDDITYRFTFTRSDEDPTTFFNIRFGQRNQKLQYTLEKSVNGGAFATIVSNGMVPPNNIGPRSIQDATVGLGTTYDALMAAAVATATTGEKVFAGPADDPYFADNGALYDLADAPRANPRNALAGLNVGTLAIQASISSLQKNGQDVGTAVSILDSDFVIGVWASASRRQVRTLNGDGTRTYSGPWVQVSRLGMPLTNTLYMPLGEKDRWNALTPYSEDPAMEDYLCNPELGLYMDASLFANAIPAWAPLRIQRNSLQSFDFGNTHDGVWPILAGNGGAGTALDSNLFGNYLLRQGKPRSMDLLPLFHTGLPNLSPYHLWTGKAGGNPLAVGKPFVNNFIPTFGDMLRLNMAVPPTPRTSADFSSLGLNHAAFLGLADPRFNQNANLEAIPNMDGFPNGRRLEDDVMRINLQAASGFYLAAIGLWYDDFVSGNPITPDFLDVRNFSTGITANTEGAFRTTFPYVLPPNAGTDGSNSLSIGVFANGFE